jgi:hypothetical protein
MTDFKYDSLLEENLNLKKALASSKSVLDRTLSNYKCTLNLNNQPFKFIFRWLWDFKITLRRIKGLIW